MNLLANLSPTYRQFLLASNEVGQNVSRPVSPYAEMMDTLQALKRNDSTLYQRVKQETVTYLQTSVRTAEAALDIRQLVRRGA